MSELTVEEIKKLNIYQRIHAVMDKIAYVQQERRPGVKFPVTNYDAVVTLVRPWLQMYRIGMHTTLVSVVQGQCLKPEGEFGRERTEAIYDIFFVNIDNPEDFQISRQAGYGVDGTDKGPGMASTYAAKMALLKTFCFQTGMDPDLQSLNADPGKGNGADNPEDPEINKQVEDGRAAIRETVVYWLTVPEAKITDATAREIAGAISSLVHTYYGRTDKWFREHIQEAHPDQYGDGKADTIMENVPKPQVINTFKKVRDRAAALAEIEDAGNTVTRVRAAISSVGDPELSMYDMDGPDFTDTIQKIINWLKKGG